MTHFITVQCESHRCPDVEQREQEERIQNGHLTMFSLPCSIHRAACDERVDELCILEFRTNQNTFRFNSFNTRKSYFPPYPCITCGAFSVMLSKKCGSHPLKCSKMGSHKGGGGGVLGNEVTNS